MITTSKCKKLGLEMQSKMLYEQMKKNAEIFAPTKYEQTTVFPQNYVEQAISDLGIDFSKVEGKKWYQLFKSDWEVKVYNSLRLLKS
jgi:Zn-finger domain-containing protein